MGGLKATVVGVLALLLAVQLAVPPASAAEGDRAFLKLRKQGRKLYKKGRYEAAAERFSAAYEAAPEQHGMLFNIGLCYEKLGRSHAAVTHFQRYLTARPHAKNAGEVRGKITYHGTILGKTHAPLKVTSVPPGADVYVDDARDPLGKTPLEGWLTLGPHQLRLKFTGHTPQSRLITAKAGAPVTLAVSLVAVNAPGRIFLLSEDDMAGATVKVDGRSAGALPVPTGLELPPGSHHLVITLEGRERFDKTVDVEPGKELTLRVILPRLTPLDAPAPKAASGGGIPMATWIVGGAGIASLLTSLALYVTALGEADDTRRYAALPGATDAEWRSKADSAEGLLLGSQITLGLGLAALAGATAIALLGGDDAAEDEAARLDVVPLPGGAAASLTWGF